MELFKEVFKTWRTRNSPIMILHKFHRPPYGGGNQFLLALKNEWEKMGFQVGTGAIGSETRFALFNSFNFDFDIVRKANREKVKMIHRVDGPVSAYRGEESKEDQQVWSINHECADVTVFQSYYSLEKHKEMGLVFKNPVVIPNAANPDIFFPTPERKSISNRKIKIIATSWSSNLRKGAKVYQWLDQNLDKKKYEFTFVGQIVIDLPNSRVLKAMPSEQLADELRQHDIYITASENDPCSNALIEAQTCGLPAVFLKSGGHPELVGEGGMGFDSQDQIPALLNQIASNYEAFQKRVNQPQMSDVAQKYLNVMGVK